MARPVRDDESLGCHDSFLDVVTNIVGILIILVVVAGLRAQKAPVDTSLLKAAAASPARVALERERASEKSVEADVYRVAQQIVAVEREAAARAGQRDQLATLANLLERKIHQQREQLDSKARADFDRQRQLSDARQRLAELQAARAQVDGAEPESVVIENHPTPLGKTVDQEEAHFQLRGGRIAYIPLERLLERFKSDVRSKMYKLLELPEISDTVGPEGGFRLRYTMERREVSLESQIKTGRGTYAQLKQWTLIPVSGELGESIDAALGEGSAFRQTLASLDAKTTVTLWVYPDSFAEFRRLRKDLYDRKIACAARPLPDGAPIGGSPDGSKSASE